MTDATTPSPEPAQRGTTTIADGVVAKVASLAVHEIDAVAGLGGPLSGAVGQVVGRLRGREHATTGVGVEVGTSEAAVDLAVRIHYPASIPQVAEQIRENVVDRIERLVGLKVVEVNIAVVDMVFPHEEDEEADQAAEAPPRVE